MLGQDLERESKAIAGQQKTKATQEMYQQKYKIWLCAENVPLLYTLVLPPTTMVFRGGLRGRQHPSGCGNPCTSSDQISVMYFPQSACDRSSAVSMESSTCPREESRGTDMRAVSLLSRAFKVAEK